MKRRYFGLLGLFIISVILISGCVQEVKEKNCGELKVKFGESLGPEEMLAREEMRCLIDAVPECHNAKLTVNAADMQIMEVIIKKEGEQCFAYNNILKGGGEGLSAKCKIEQDKEKFIEFAVSTDPNKLKNCTGTFVEEYFKKKEPT